MKETQAVYILTNVEKPPAEECHAFYLFQRGSEPGGYACMYIWFGDEKSLPAQKILYMLFLFFTTTFLIPLSYGMIDGEPYDGSIVNMGVKNAEGSICYIIGLQKDIHVKTGKKPGDKVWVWVTIRERE